MKKVRTRFAPSPTGYLHIGSLRTVLYAYAWAKKNNGDFLLRIEDTDQERVVEGAVAQIIKSIDWAGISIDEGVIGVDEKGAIIEKGELGPYVQSSRIDLYNKFAQELLEQNKAYKCYCTAERLEDMRVIQRAAKQMPKYDRHCLHLSEDELAKNEADNMPFVIRFHVPEGGDVAWDDEVFGHISFTRDQVDDFVMIKADKFPTYNFAVVVDDHMMEITHIMRGHEFLSSTPKHLLLYEAFGWETPALVHLPPILGKSKKKLSKRDGDVSVDLYREKGYLSEALINYISLQGWNPKNDQEVFGLEEMIKLFDLNEIQRSGATFDLAKLYWFNAQYLKKLSVSELTDLCLPYLIRVNMLKNTDSPLVYETESGQSIAKAQLEKMIATEQERLNTLSEITEKMSFYLSEQLSYSSELLAWKGMSTKDVQDCLSLALAKLSMLSEENWNQTSIESALREVVAESGKKVGEIFWPLRVALTGLQASPGPHEVAGALGKVNTLKRIELGIKLVS